MAKTLASLRTVTGNDINVYCSSLKSFRLETNTTHYSATR